MIDRDREKTTKFRAAFCSALGLVSDSWGELSSHVVQSLLPLSAERQNGAHRFLVRAVCLPCKFGRRYWCPAKFGAQLLNQSINMHRTWEFRRVRSGVRIGVRIRSGVRIGVRIRSGVRSSAGASTVVSAEKTRCVHRCVGSVIVVFAKRNRIRGRAEQSCCPVVLAIECRRADGAHRLLVRALCLPCTKQFNGVPGLLDRAFVLCSAH